ncbi:hypothetical protein [Streptomyces sp. DASNCL29]|uniref:hypothetical protein n=1 Tax=Streptomyces sp. DASNCL29 TaxID=2583819 RepID=UPI00110FB4B6|nr:hypothetical protein [Streptomyces sp. DASNCL29]TMU92899.1 hypothetical protein FGK60_25655 [Streptomyces sp. DASNCL29]
MPLPLNPLDAAQLLTALSTAGAFLVLVAGTGLLTGLVLPGDSLLFTAGLPRTAAGGGARLSLPGVRPPHPLAAVIVLLPLAPAALRARRARTAAEPTPGSAK